MNRLVASLAVGAAALAACRATPEPPAPRPPASEAVAAAPVDVAPVAAGGAVASDPATRRRHAELMRWAVDSGLPERPLGERAVALGQRLLGAPYVAGLLDAPDEETLLAPLDKFDCVLYVESVLAMAQGLGEGDTTFEGYLARIEAMRYRGGQMDGYGSRLHYFSEWIDDNADRGLVADLTADLPGQAAYDHPLSFMTANRSRYPHLSDPAAFRAVRDAEVRANAVPRAHVPKARVRAAYDQIETGDVIATTTNIAGLDVTHVGFAVKDASGRVGFLHASPQGGVKLSPDLHAYLAGNRAQVGVFIVRPR